MAEWVLRYADSRGEMHQQVANAEARQKFEKAWGVKLTPDVVVGLTLLLAILLDSVRTRARQH